MSLDITLNMPGHDNGQKPHDKIMVRRGGRTIEISRKEWDELYPGSEPIMFRCDPDITEVFHANCTHNMEPMAKEADLLGVMWVPEALDIVIAHQAILPLIAGIHRLVEKKGLMESHNPANGWGDYNLLLEVATSYLAACVKYPNSIMTISR